VTVLDYLVVAVPGLDANNKSLFATDDELSKLDRNMVLSSTSYCYFFALPISALTALGFKFPLFILLVMYVFILSQLPFIYLVFLTFNVSVS